MLDKRKGQLKLLAVKFGDLGANDATCMNSIEISLAFIFFSSRWVTKCLSLQIHVLYHKQCWSVGGVSYHYWFYVLFHWLTSCITFYILFDNRSACSHHPNSKKIVSGFFEMFAQENIIPIVNAKRSIHTTLISRII